MSGFPQVIQVFSREKVRHNRNRAAAGFAGHDFLFRLAAERLAERLGDIKREFSDALQIGARGGEVLRHHFRTMGKAREFTVLETAERFFDGDVSTAQGEAEFMPFADASFDMVVSALSLHTVNDLPGALLQIRRILKPDGLFLAAMPGGRTLYELRSAMMNADMALHGGASPHVAPFADKRQMGALMQRARFALPVVDSETVTATYTDMKALVHDLRGMGEGNAQADRGGKSLGRRYMTMAQDYYREKFSDPDGRLRATFEIIFLIGWAPHESQQKPLRPGSATARLSDALGTREISSGVKTGREDS